MTFSNRTPSTRTLEASLVVLTLLLVLTGCAAPQEESAPVQTLAQDTGRNRAQIEPDFYNSIDEVIKVSGITFPSWNREEPARTTFECVIGDAEQKTVTTSPKPITANLPQTRKVQQAKFEII